MLVSCRPHSLEPVRKTRVQAGAPHRREASVRHLAREGVLDHELPLAGKRRAGSMADEVALLEQPQVRLDALPSSS